MYLLEFVTLVTQMGIMIAVRQLASIQVSFEQCCSALLSIICHHRNLNNARIDHFTSR